MALRIAAVDAAIDGSHAAREICDMIDADGEWDWTDGSETDPCDRVAVVESSGAWWTVYRGTEPDEMWRFETCTEAQQHLATLVEESSRCLR